MWRECCERFLRYLEMHTLLFRLSLSHVVSFFNSVKCKFSRLVLMLTWVQGAVHHNFCSDIRINNFSHKFLS